LRLILLGAPGAGKGVQGDKISEKFGVPKISTGDILRNEIETCSELGNEAQCYIEKGELVTDALMDKIIENRIVKDDCKNGFLLDGYPRTLPQAEFLSAMLSNLNISIDAVLNLKVDEELIIKRLSSRRICESCAKVYNLLTDPPPDNGKCSVCGGNIYQRKDDRENVISERFKVYRELTEPLISFYMERGILYEVEGNGAIETVNEKMINLINDLIKKTKIDI